jgi:hypothetical protein
LILFYQQRPAIFKKKDTTKAKKQNWFFEFQMNKNKAHLVILSPL